MRPFFSLVIPTKNRSHIIGDAIRNVLKQKFDDYEIVVMDNDDDEQATATVVKAFSDPRIRYFRSGGLSMADNWDAASRQARGEYVMFMQDKQFLYLRAFETIYNAIHTYKPLCIHWYVDMINNTDRSACVFSNLHGSRQPDAEYITAGDMLNHFLNNGHYFAPYDLPKGYNSCTHHSLIEQVRTSVPDGKLCLPVAPDCTIAYLQLAHVDRVLRINQALSAIAWAGGNGVSYTMKTQTGPATQFVQQVGAGNIYNRVPIRSHTLVTNMVYNDFLNTRDLVGGHLAEIPFSFVPYFVLAFDEIGRRIRMGVDMRDEAAAWHSALHLQPTSVQAAVQRGIRPFERERAEYQRAVFMQKTGLKRVIGKFQQITGLSAVAWEAAKSVPKFPNLLAAVEWEARGEYEGVLTSQN